VKDITNVSLGHISDLAKLAGYVPEAEVGVLEMLKNSQAEVMFVRFAYLVAKELAD
jgi:hypothetical protein